MTHEREEKRMTKATEKQISYLRDLRAEWDVRYPAGYPAAIRERIDAHMQAAIDDKLADGMDVEHASELIDALVAGTYGPKSLLKACDVTREVMTQLTKTK